MPSEQSKSSTGKSSAGSSAGGSSRRQGFYGTSSVSTEAERLYRQGQQEDAYRTLTGTQSTSTQDTLASLQGRSTQESKSSAGNTATAIDADIERITSGSSAGTLGSREGRVMIGYQPEKTDNKEAGK